MHKIIRFLVRVSENNNREWFLMHKGEFSEIQSVFACEVKRIMDVLGEVDPRVNTIPVKSCLLRFSRDMRFASSSDNPFKEGLTAIIAPYGKFRNNPAYCIQMQQGKSYVAGGMLKYCPAARKAIRNHIAAHTERYANILNDEKFSRLFPAVGPERLKKFPSGYSKEEPYAQYLYASEFMVKLPIIDRDFSKPGWQRKLGEAMQTMKPFLDFIDEALQVAGVKDGES